MKKIYLVFTYTGSFLSTLIRMYTKKEYSHVSISLDHDLTKMYSFGRHRPYNPIDAGFVRESPNFGTFKRFKKTKTRICSLEITEEKYQKLEAIIKKMKKKKNLYKFNFLGLVAVALNMKVKRERHFYCAEFVKYVLEESKVSTFPEIVKPEDFEKIADLKEIYRGFLQEYKQSS